MVSKKTLPLFLFSFFSFLLCFIRVRYVLVRYVQYRYDNGPRARTTLAREYPAHVPPAICAPFAHRSKCTTSSLVHLRAATVDAVIDVTTWALEDAGQSFDDHLSLPLIEPVENFRSRLEDFLHLIEDVP